MLRIFTPVKIQRLRPGLNPRTRVPEASMLTTRPPKPSLLEKQTWFQLFRKFASFCGTRIFITAFTRARYLSLSLASSIQSIPSTSHILKIHLNITLPSMPGSPKWYLSFRFPHKNPVHAFPLPHTRYMPRPPHSSRFCHRTILG